MKFPATVRTGGKLADAAHPADGAERSGNGSLVGGQAKAFDREELLSRCLGNLALARRVLERFEKDFPKNTERFAELAGEGNEEEFRRLAHQLKGAAANMAAGRLQQQFAALERLAGEHRLAEADAALEILAGEWLQFQSEVRSLSDGD